MSAVRLARGYTGRDMLVKFEGCYHGHVDALMVSSGSGLATFGIASSPGIPQDTVATTLICPLDDLEAAELGGLAAAQLEHLVPQRLGQAKALLQCNLYQLVDDDYSIDSAASGGTA